MKKIYIAIGIALVTVALLTVSALVGADYDAKFEDMVTVSIDEVLKDHEYNGNTANHDGSNDSDYSEVLLCSVKNVDLERDDAWGHKRVCAIVIPTEYDTSDKGRPKLTGHKPTKVCVPAHAVLESPALKFCEGEGGEESEGGE